MEVNLKLNNLILYILSHPAYQEGGVKKLNKLLYFVDFYFYRQHERLISGATYAKADMGPVLDNYRDIFSRLTVDGDLRLREENGIAVYDPLHEADLSLFGPEEIDHVSKVLDRYGKLSGRDLELISHEQQPWLLTERMGQTIDPDLALLIDDQESDSAVVVNDALKRELERLANQVD